MTYEEERRALESRLRSVLSHEEAAVVAFAQVPWLDRGAGTYAFFEAMRSMRDQFADVQTSDLPNEDELFRAATKTVETYADLARDFGAREYQSAAKEILRGSLPDVHVEGGGRGEPDDEVLPVEVPLVVGTTTLHLEALESKKGNAWYTLLSETGNPLRGGTAVAPDRPGLPETVQLGDVELELGPAPLWDDEARQYSETEHEPFDVKRLVERDVVLGEHEFRVRVLVSARRDGDWNVTAKLWPQETVPFAEVRDADRRLPFRRPPARTSADQVESTERGSREYDSPQLDLLLEALSDATD